MFFNPLFMQSIAEAGIQTANTSNKLGNSKYLFSDIIKVFNESDPTTASAVLPESTSVSSAPEIFSFQSPDMSNGAKYQDQKSVEGNNNQNILELISSILFTNTTPAEPLQIENGLQKLPGANSDGTSVLSPGSKELVVQSESLLNLLTQILSAVQAADLTSTKEVTSTEPLPGGENNLEVLVSSLMKKLETDGEAVIQLENAGQNIQFKISKIDETKNENSVATASTVANMPTAIQSAEASGQLNITGKTNEPDQSSLVEVVEETPSEAGIVSETAKQKGFKKAASAARKVKSNPEQIKNSPVKPVMQSRNIDSEIDKLILQATESKVEQPLVDANENTTNSKINFTASPVSGEKLTVIDNEVSETTPEIKSTTTPIQLPQVETKSNNVDLSSNNSTTDSARPGAQFIKGGSEPIESEQQLSKSEVPAEKAEIQPGKTVVQSSAAEVPLNKIEVEISKTETQLNKTANNVDNTEIQSDDVKVQLNKTEAKSSNSEVRASKTEVAYNKSEVQPDKLEVQSGKMETQSGETETVSNKVEVQPNSVEGQTGKTEASLNKVEVQSNTPEAKANKPEMQSGKTEIPPAKVEMQQAGLEVQASKTEVPSNKIEVQSNTPEAKANKPEMQSGKAEIPPAKVEMQQAGLDTQASKTEVSLNKVEVQPSASEKQASKVEIPPNKTELQQNKSEAPINKTEIPINKIELQSNKSEGQSSKTEIQTNETEVSSNKVELQQSGLEAKASKTVVSSNKVEVQSNTPGVQANKPEVQSGKAAILPSETEVASNKVALQPDKSEAQENKTEVQPGKTEMQIDRNNDKLSKAEVKPIKTAQLSVTNNLKADPQQFPVAGEKVTSESQINKAVNSKLNLNSERLIHALEVSSGTLTSAKNLSSYKIVMQVSEKETEAASAKNGNNSEVINSNTTLRPPQMIFSKEVMADKIKNLVANQAVNSSKVDAKISFSKQPFPQNLFVNSDFTVDVQTLNISGDQNKVDAADINLLNRLALTNTKLASTSKPDIDVKVVENPLGKVSTPLLKQVAAETLRATQDQKEISPSNELISKTTESSISSKPVSVEVRKEVVVQKLVDTPAQQGNDETKQTEQQIFNQSSKPVVKQAIETSNAAPVLNEPLNVKSKNETGPKKNSPEVQKIAPQSETEKPVVKTLMTNSEFSADTKGQQASSEVNTPKEVKREAAKPASEVEETKPAETQQNVSTNHQAHEIKVTAPKEKIASTNFQLPETERTIKSFELSKEIAKIIESGTSQKVVLRLLPEALGKVKLTLEVGGEVIHAKAEVENESVRQIIQTNTESLKQTLSQNGLQLASFNVSLAGSDEKHQKAHGQKKRSNTFSNKSKIEKQVLPEATRTLGYNTYEYLA